MKRVVALIAVMLTAWAHAQVSVCAGQQVTISATNPSSLSNPTYSINPGGFTSSNPLFVVSPSASVTYTIYTTGTDSGSNVVTTTSQTNVTVYGLPTFSIVSTPFGYTLGCSSKSVVVITFVNAQTAPPFSGGAVSFTVLHPGGGQAAPAVTLSPAQQYSISQAGTYTAITRDNTSGCDAFMLFNVVDNKLAPTIDSVLVPLLSCATNTAVLQAYSSSSNINYKWTIPPQNTAISGNTLTVSVNAFQPPTNTVTGIYTVAVQDNNNLCKTEQAVVVKQNIFPPNAFIQSSANALTCLTTSILLTNSSISGIPSGTFPSNQPVTTVMWVGPSLGPPQTYSNTYAAYVPGTYTLTVKDMNNGCTSSTVKTILDNRIFPVVNTAGPFDLCGQTTTTLIPVFMGSTGGYTYIWTSPPGATTGATNGPMLVTNTPGTYTLATTNTYGCETETTFDVVRCIALSENDRAVVFDVFPNPGNGEFRINFAKGGPVHMQVFDARLSLLKELKINNGEIIDLSSQPPGIYFINIPGERISRRVIRE